MPGATSAQRGPAYRYREQVAHWACRRSPRTLLFRCCCKRTLCVPDPLQQDTLVGRQRLAIDAHPPLVARTYPKSSGLQHLQAFDGRARGGQGSRIVKHLSVCSLPSRCSTACNLQKMEAAHPSLPSVCHHREPGPSPQGSAMIFKWLCLHCIVYTPKELPSLIASASPQQG